MEQKTKKAPIGVKIISSVYIVASALMFIAGSALIASANAVESLLSNFASTFSNVALMNSRVVTTSGIAMIAIAIFGIALGALLWKLKNWARITIIVLAGLSLLGGIRSLFLGKYQVIGWMVLNLIIVYYLIWTKSAKEAFK